MRQPAAAGGRPSSRGSRTPARRAAASRASRSPWRFDDVPPVQNVPVALTGSPMSAASQRTTRSSTSVAAGAWSKESIDWLVAPTATSAAADASSGAACRCAAQRGSPGFTPCASTVSPRSRSTVAASAPSGGQGSIASIVARSRAGSAPDHGPARDARAASTASAAIAASRASSPVALGAPASRPAPGASSARGAALVPSGACAARGSGAIAGCAACGPEAGSGRAARGPAGASSAACAARGPAGASSAACAARGPNAGAPSSAAVSEWRLTPAAPARTPRRRDRRPRAR
jgi:hypothetical protein